MKRKLKIIASGMAALLLLITAVEGTVSWFIDNRQISIESSSVGIAVDSGKLEISLDGASWGTELKLKENELSYSVDITGDGIDFWYPKTLDDNDEPIITQANSFIAITNDNHEGAYISFDVYMRSTTPSNVYLSSSSYVEGLEEFLVGSTSAYARKSLYGQFSADAIAGAARVSFVDITDEEKPELKCIWAPHDEYRLSYTDQEAEMTIKADAKDRESALEAPDGYRYMYKDGQEIKTHYYTGFDYASGLFATDVKKLATSTNINNSVPVMSFSTSGAYEVRKLRINIWFEGTDREADKALNGGMVNYYLQFVVISKNELKYTLSATESASDIRTVSWSTEKEALVYTVSGEEEETKFEQGKLQYSFDGITWNTNLAQLKAKKTVQMIYIRVPETATTAPSNVISVVIPASAG